MIIHLMQKKHLKKVNTLDKNSQQTRRKWPQQNKGHV